MRKGSALRMSLVPVTVHLLGAGSWEIRGLPSAGTGTPGSEAAGPFSLVLVHSLIPQTLLSTRSADQSKLNVHQLEVLHLHQSRCT